MTLASMTGYAEVRGARGGLAWTWDARSVNGRGLDLRLRLPDGFEALDPAVRAAFGQAFARGSISVTLRLGRGEGSPAVPRLSEAGLAAALDLAAAAGAAAAARGLPVAPLGVGGLLAVRGVLESDGAQPGQDAPLVAAIAEGIAPLAAGLADARAGEGAGLAATLAARLDDVERLLGAARASAAARAARTGALLRERVAAVLEVSDVPDPARLAQELALIAVKADVSEELDRLEVHVAAARGLLAGDGPAGRRLDFLIQEFNREANTLCAKAGDPALTAIGLEMKVVIDQMREQVQNVE